MTVMQSSHQPSAATLNKFFSNVPPAEKTAASHCSGHALCPSAKVALILVHTLAIVLTMLSLIQMKKSLLSWKMTRLRVCRVGVKMKVVLAQTPCTSTQNLLEMLTGMYMVLVLCNSAL